jgi:hypothetical protein
VAVEHFDGSGSRSMCVDLVADARQRSRQYPSVLEQRDLALRGTDLSADGLDSHRWVRGVGDFRELLDQRLAPLKAAASVMMVRFM